MDDSNIELRREVQELRIEVRRLRDLIVSATLILSIGFAVMFPDLLIIVVPLGLLILFGFLVSRQRRLIFQSFFSEM